MNYDEAILRSGMPNPAAPFPILHQILRIALYHEYATRAYYLKVMEAFGERAPFSQIAQSEARHIEALTRLCERFGVPRPLDSFSAQTVVAPTWRMNLERAILDEVQTVQLYDRLLPFASDPSVVRVFMSLRAAALNSHLPAFQRAQQQAAALESYHASQGIPATQAYVQHGPLTNLFEQGFSLLARQNSVLGLAGSLVKSADPAFLMGIFAGGATLHYVRKKLRNRG